MSIYNVESRDFIPQYNRAIAERDELSREVKRLRELITTSEKNCYIKELEDFNENLKLQIRQMAGTIRQLSNNIV